MCIKKMSIEQLTLTTSTKIKIFSKIINLTDVGWEVWGR